MQRRRFLAASLFLLFSACATTPPPEPVTPPAALPKPRIALALGGGAAKGFAHIGVIKVLEAHGIHADIVTGTSAGSVVGSLYAAGYSGFQLQKVAQQLDEADLRDLTVSSQGFIKGEALQAYVNRLVGNRNIEKLGKPFGAVATDLSSGRRVVFRRGNTGQAVRASCSIPNVFIPPVIQGRRYVDGGLTSPVPVSAAREMGADLIIAVDISARARNGKAEGFLGLLDQSVTIMGARLLNQELKDADVVIHPSVGQIGGADFDARNRAILEGEKAAQQMMPLIRARIDAKARELAAAQAATRTVSR